ncbi:MAG: hypothetical protein ACTH58_02250 [Marinomonas foliarum]|jgi:hypothetical protein|uniref:Oxidoreductase molybdopterin-binding domain-containing protein n=1 Tax=Marinomonas foliarum TaxID=491950 RepID=A0A369AC50_9GAMM|nr:hypothetical protein [Marinomonas foliarum]QRV25610.1 hypothetical protein JSY38_08930 [Marinomonas foliarum]RCX06753.1 hypothetical protein DFP77_10816 [Marinomonas foliarum]
MRLLSFIFLVSGFCLTSYALADNVPNSPTGRIVLTVSGTAIDAGQVGFDMAMLDALPQHKITTHTPWTQGPHTYRGFSAVDLLSYLGSDGNLLQVTALNQYMTEIPISDFIEKGAIFATRQDERLINVRSLGPIMVIYPFDQQEELKSEKIYGRSIWQVTHIKSILLVD